MFHRENEEDYRERVYSVNSQIQDILFQAENREISWKEALEWIKSTSENIEIGIETDEEEEGWWKQRYKD